MDGSAKPDLVTLYTVKWRVGGAGLSHDISCDMAGRRQPDSVAAHILHYTGGSESRTAVCTADIH